MTMDGAMLREGGNLPLWFRIAVVPSQWGQIPIDVWFCSLSSCCLAPDMGKVAGSGWERQVNKDSDFLPEDWKEELQGTAKSQGDPEEGGTWENNPIELFVSS